MRLVTVGSDRGLIQDLVYCLEVKHAAASGLEDKCALKWPAEWGFVK